MDLQGLINEVDLKIGHEMKRLTEKQDEKLSVLRDELDQMRKEAKQQKTELTEVTNMVEAQTLLLKRKVEFEQIERLWKHFEGFAMYDDLKELYKKTVPEIFKFERKIEE